MLTELLPCIQDAQTSFFRVIYVLEYGDFFSTPVMDYSFPLKMNNY